MRDEGDQFRVIPKMRSLVNSSTLTGLRTSLWGFTDQAFITGSNFFMMLLLACVLEPSVYPDIELVHHPTLNTIEGPGILWKSGKPFVWASDGGAQTPPPQLRQYLKRLRLGERLGRS